MLFLRLKFVLLLGSGKTTLLDLLTGRRKSSTVDVSAIAIHACFIFSIRSVIGKCVCEWASFWRKPKLVHRQHGVCAPAGHSLLWGADCEREPDSSSMGQAPHQQQREVPESGASHGSGETSHWSIGEITCRVALSLLTDWFDGSSWHCCRRSYRTRTEWRAEAKTCCSSATAEATQCHLPWWTHLW